MSNIPTASQDNMDAQGLALLALSPSDVNTPAENAAIQAAGLGNTLPDTWGAVMSSLSPATASVATGGLLSSPLKSPMIWLLGGGVVLAVLLASSGN